MTDPLALAQQLLDDARSGRPDGMARVELASLDPDELAAALADDVPRIMFWLNVYNAIVRARILADPAACRPPRPGARDRPRDAHGRGRGRARRAGSWELSAGLTKAASAPHASGAPARHSGDSNGRLPSPRSSAVASRQATSRSSANPRSDASNASIVGRSSARARKSA